MHLQKVEQSFEDASYIEATLCARCRGCSHNAMHIELLRAFTVLFYDLAIEAALHRTPEPRDPDCVGFCTVQRMPSN